MGGEVAIYILKHQKHLMFVWKYTCTGNVKQPGDCFPMHKVLRGYFFIHAPVHDTKVLSDLMGCNFE